MIPALTITQPDWMRGHAAQSLMDILNGEGDTVAMFVGGCVRNAVCGESVMDIDIATSLTPTQVMDILAAAQVRVIPTGIDHGTVTAVHEGRTFEITTLRRDVATDGRHAVVAFSTDWAEDAARRDFTINTLLADASGRIYDPLAQGLADLQAGHVIFVGNAQQRVAEDYLRVLRFFRFHARYGKGKADDSALAACRGAADKIRTLSRERITDELFKILAVDNPAPALRLMFDCGVLADLVDEVYQDTDMNLLVSLQKQGLWLDRAARLGLLLGYSEQTLNRSAQYLVLSNETKNALALYQDVPPTAPGPREAKLWIYRHGHALARQMVCIGLMRARRDKITNDIFEILQDWEVPVLPVGGQELMKEGISAGPEIGRLLRLIETWWIENDYAPDRESCLIKLEQLKEEN